MTDYELLSAADVPRMQTLAQRLTANHPQLVAAGGSYGELAWIWGKGHADLGAHWPRRLWFDRGEPIAWAWAQLPYHVTRNDGTVKAVTGASLTYQVDPDHRSHPALLEEIITWFDALAPHLERTVIPSASDEFALSRWAAPGYVTDPSSLGDTGFWTQLNARDLTDVEQPALPTGFTFRTADEAGPEAAVQAHLDVWGPTPYRAETYEGVRETSAYRGDLHLLVEAPDGRPAASAIMWFDEANKTVEFEPVGTHPDHRRKGVGRAMMLHGLRQARSAGATHATVACLGAPGHPRARGLYYSVGFREISRDAPLISTGQQ